MSICLFLLLLAGHIPHYMAFQSLAQWEYGWLSVLEQWMQKKVTEVSIFSIEMLLLLMAHFTMVVLT